ncbi:MAG: hypothetical protein KF683_16405 [Rubrivivax sp.]|nr:hypothetical protein [Rubrivivax sp.]
MKLLFGLIGAALVIAFLLSFIVKVQEPAMLAVALVGIVMMLVDLWQARNEADT